MAEKIDVPHYAIMALTNQSPKNDMTGRYLVLDIERVRFYSERISESFVRLLGLDKNDLGVGKRIEAEERDQSTRESVAHTQCLQTHARK